MHSTLDHPKPTDVHLKTTLKIYFTHAPSTLTPLLLAWKPVLFKCLSLTTKLIESSTIAHSDEEEDRNDTHWRLGLTAISLNGLWVTFTLTAS